MIFRRSLQELDNSIHAAMRCHDPVVLQLARERLERALDLGEALPAVLAASWRRRIDAMLPGDWPFWMGSLDAARDRLH